MEEKHPGWGVEISHAVSDHGSDALRNLSAASRTDVSPN